MIWISNRPVASDSVATRGRASEMRSDIGVCLHGYAGGVDSADPGTCRDHQWVWLGSTWSLTDPSVVQEWVCEDCRVSAAGVPGRSPASPDSVDVQPSDPR